MVTLIRRAKLITKNGKTTIEKPTPRMDASKRKKVHAQASRLEKQWKGKSK